MSKNFASLLKASIFGEILCDRIKTNNKNPSFEEYLFFMEAFIIKAGQFILCLAILIFLHELGHFTFARIFKTRIDKFYLFFNLKISLFRAKKINGKWQFKFFAPNVPANERPKRDADGDIILDDKKQPIMELIPLNELADDDWRKYPESTEWGIGWLPFGGYCKIAGMIDESMDTTQLQCEPKQWEYRSRPIWQRMFIISGGVLVNFVLALMIFSAVLFTWGREYIPLENAKYGLQFSQTLLDNGFENGDNVIKIDGESLTQTSDVVKKILIEGKQNIIVLRNGQLVEIKLPKDIAQTILKKEEADLVSMRYPFVITTVAADTPAAQANLQKGDSLVGINGQPLFVYQDIVKALDENKNSSIELAYVRDGVLQETTVNLTETGKLGVDIKRPFQILQTKQLEYTFFESIPAGISLGWQTLSDYVKQFRLVFTKEGAKQIGGFGTLGSLFAPVWDWHSFWMMTALLSIILAFMNFLPIPALDGGHFLFLLYEMIARRKPNEKFMEYAHTIGFFLLIALLLYANGNDIIRFFFK